MKKMIFSYAAEVNCYRCRTGYCYTAAINRFCNNKVAHVNQLLHALAKLREDSITRPGTRSGFSRESFIPTLPKRPPHCRTRAANRARDTRIMSAKSETWHPFITVSAYSGQSAGYAISKLLRSIEKKRDRMRIDSVAAANGDGCSATKFRPRPDSLNEWYRCWVLRFSDGDVGRSAVHVAVLAAPSSLPSLSVSLLQWNIRVFCNAKIVKLALTYLLGAYVARVSSELSVLFFWIYAARREIDFRHTCR